MVDAASSCSWQLASQKKAADKTKNDKNKSFNAKEKRKRELGQQAKDKNWVEEEKRILRQAGDF